MILVKQEFWRQVLNTILCRSDPADQDMDYADIAKVFHDQHRKKLGPLPPVIDPDLSGDAAVDAWRDALCGMADIIYEDHKDARAKIWVLRTENGRAAERLRREIAGIEAHRLVNAFDKALNLQDRVGRMIARDLKTYRELQASRPPTDRGAEEEPRNEPNLLL